MQVKHNVVFSQVEVSLALYLVLEKDEGFSQWISMAHF